MALAKKARAIIVAKGKKVDEFKVKGTPDDEVVDAMLGPTGNLRAPTIVVGSTLVVGFSEDAYAKALLG